ncbi:hypothetical protein L2E82_14687 [Cichorium intybus]|uniref:Uncharacterized protein n=1 Tax=Cichorium intybus TaxID=13427 RepID=A0ACB9F142_CICIN|nr:hypothetical protein L2E82_14687 [Cichorium intybus]
MTHAPHLLCYPFTISGNHRHSRKDQRDGSFVITQTNCGIESWFWGLFRIRLISRTQTIIAVYRRGRTL